MRTAIVLAAVLGAAGAARADNWPQFRGPTGVGFTAEKNLPVTWGGEKGENVLWKSPLVGDGHASPIVWGDRVFVSTVRWADGKPDPKIIPEHHLVCYSVADGKKLWDTTIEPGPWRRDDFRSGAGGGYAAPTPATDGKHVYVIYSSSVIASVDFDGKIGWRQEIKPHTFDVTIGASPVLFGDTVILLCAMAKPADSRIVAFAKSDGSIKWETKLPTVRYGHSTPLLLDVKGKPQLVILTGGGEAKDAFQGFDPADGKKIWWCKGAGESSSPAYGAGILFADSGRGGNGFAVDPTGEGDLSATNVKWTVGGFPESLGSPIIVGEHVYRLQGSGVLRILKTADGAETDKQRLPGVSTRPSPIADPEGRIFFASGGKSFVIQAGPQIKVLATNDLGEPSDPSPAASNGKLFIVGTKHVFCVGQKP